MSHDSKLETLGGHLRQLLFSPKGGIEGVLLEVDRKRIQVAMTPGAIDAVRLQRAVGKIVEVKAQPDHSPKAKRDNHPLYQLRSIVKIGGRPVKARYGEVTAIRGVVTAIHFARHGEPNGVILEAGEFVHTRPDGMKKLDLKIGSKVVVRGETRMTVLGSPLIEACEINRVPLE